MPEYEAIVLSTTGDFLVKDNSTIDRLDNGVEFPSPEIIDEDGEPQPIQAKTVFIPYEALDSIQFGEFDSNEL